MSEAWASPVAKVWGCSDRRAGWVPNPGILPRRNPLVDAVGRIDDPCERPAHELPDFAPTPKFKAPREGYPNNMCNLEDFTEEKEADAEEYPDAVMNITVAPGTPHEICLRPQPILQTDTIYATSPPIEDCCKDARSLNTIKAEAKKILGPHEELEMGMKNWAQCQSPCGPLLPKYPCRGVIRSPRSDWIHVSKEDRCKPSISLGSDADLELKPLSGREFVEGKRTCDLYPIHSELPARFNNPEWFKGYGCEKSSSAHPFYLTTSSNYGRFAPTAHTMTQSYFPKQCQFTKYLAKAGMPRNRSLNLASDKTIC